MGCMLNLVLPFLGLLLIHADKRTNAQGLNMSSSSVDSINQTANQTPSTTRRQETIHSTTQAHHKVLLVKVSWNNNNPCMGTVHLSLPKGERKTVCYNSPYRYTLKDFCEQRRCERFDKHEHPWKESEEESERSYIQDSGTVTNKNCTGLLIHCKEPRTSTSSEEIPQAVSNHNHELVAYKVITGLLIVLVLAVLFFFFGKPTYAAIRKRMSQKRQSRWVGPTQTQSVYYNRDQPPGPNNNTFKRHSYPALEKLTVGASRETSSNRNSDYSYN